MTVREIKKQLEKLGNPEKKKVLQRFFKTGPGEYGEGDVFLGVRVPEQRQVAKQFTHLSFDKLQKLLDSQVHEHRLTALLILVQRFEKGDKKEIFDFYLDNTNNVNNWDLVDLTADKIVGAYLIDKDRTPLYELAQSDDLWEKRISIVATYHFIKNNQYEDTLKIGEILLNDEHDLIHKAVGWMLREVGKRNQEKEEEFLKKYHKDMPRTMLRYAIEKFDDEKRKFYMS